MTKLCRVCQIVYIRGKAKSCKHCRDFDMIASAVFRNDKRLKKVNLKDFPNVPALANHLKDLFKIQEGRCEYTNYYMNLPYSNPAARRTGTICSPDRKNPKGEYSKDNTVLILSKINILKNDIESEEDFYVICKRIVDNFENKHRNLIQPSKLSEEELVELAKKQEK